MLARVDSIDRRAVATLLAVLLLAFLMMALFLAGSEADRAPAGDSVRLGPVVLGVDGSSGSCQGECSGGTGGDSVGGAGGTNSEGSSVQGSNGQAGASGVPGLAGSQGTPGTAGSSNNQAGSFEQSSFSGSSESNVGDAAPEGQAAESSPDQFVPVTPESTQPPQEAPQSTCAAGDLLGLGSLLAPLADILKLLKLC
jgi:hypothetical protein